MEQNKNTQTIGRIERDTIGYFVAAAYPAKLFEMVENLFFPEFCVGCGRLGALVCDKCAHKITPIDFPLCIFCDKPCIDGRPHKYCQSKLLISSFNSPFTYEGLIKKIIIKSKFGSQSYKLLKILTDHKTTLEILQYVPKVDLIIPAPMTKKLIPKRIKNHSLYIAEEISKIINVPVIDILQKSNRTKQSSLNQIERAYTIRDQIYIPKPENGNELKNKSVLIIDDVTTTGSTLKETALTIQKFNPKAIHCFTLAKDPIYRVK